MLPNTWLSEVRSDNSAVGDPYWDEALGRVVLMVAVPIRVASGGRFVGALTAKLNLRQVDDILKRFIPAPAGVACPNFDGSSPLAEPPGGSPQKLTTR